MSYLWERLSVRRLTVTWSRVWCPSLWQGFWTRWALKVKKAQSFCSSMYLSTVEDTNLFTFKAFIEQNQSFDWILNWYLENIVTQPMLLLTPLEENPDRNHKSSTGLLPKSTPRQNCSAASAPEKLMEKLCWLEHYAGVYTDNALHKAGWRDMVTLQKPCISHWVGYPF